MEATTPVSVTVVPGRTQSVLVPDSGATVRDALAAASVSPEGYQLRIDGRTVEPSTPLRGGERIVLSQQVKGNRQAKGN